MEHFSYSSSDRANRIHAVMWKPEGKPVGVIQLVHGMIEYIERYDELARYFNEQGFVVVGHDHLGHGDSVKTKEDFGYIGGKNPDMHLLSDIHILRRYITKKYPDIPFFMLGHSMGSYLLRRYLTIYGEGVRGAIIMGTGEEKPAMLLPSMLLLEIMAKIKGWHYRSKLVRDLSYTKPYKKFDMKGVDKDRNWLSRDTDELMKYYGDERCSFVFTLSGYKALVRTVYQDYFMKNIRKIPKDIAVLFASGADDPVGNLGKGTTAVYEKFCKSGILEVSLKLYEGARHEIIHETNREEVFSDMGKWLSRYVKRK